MFEFGTGVGRKEGLGFFRHGERTLWIHQNRANGFQAGRRRIGITLVVVGSGGPLEECLITIRKHGERPRLNVGEKGRDGRRGLGLVVGTACRRVPGPKDGVAIVPCFREVLMPLPEKRDVQVALVGKSGE